MEKVILDALDSVYEDYFFLGREKSDPKDNILNVELSSNEKGIRSAFKDLAIAEKSYKWWLAETVLEPFKLATDEEYAEFLDMVRLVKRARYDNARKGLIPEIKSIKAPKRKKEYKEHSIDL